MSNTFVVNYNVSSLGHSYTVGGIDAMADFHFAKKFIVPNGWDVYKNKFGEWIAQAPNGEQGLLDKFFVEGADNNCYLCFRQKFYLCQYIDGSDGEVIYHQRNY